MEYAYEEIAVTNGAVKTFTPANLIPPVDGVGLRRRMSFIRCVVTNAPIMILKTGSDPTPVSGEEIAANTTFYIRKKDSYN